MSTIYDKTDNYSLNLYGDNDPADLRDGYNGSMRTIDTTLETHLNRIEGVESRETHDEEVTKALLGDNTVDKAAAAKTKWDKAGTDATAANGKADSNTAILGALGADTVDKAAALSKFVNPRTRYANTPILFIGDSITQGYRATDSSHRWSTLVAHEIGGVEKNHAVGGAGFVAEGSTGAGRFDRQAQQFAQDSSFDHDAVRLVFVEGGVNDDPTKISDGTQNCKTMLDTIKSAFPNATIIGIVGLSCWLDPSTHSTGNIPISHRRAYYQAIRQTMADNGCEVLTGEMMISRNKRYASDDYVHPNDDGYHMVASFVLSLLAGRAIDYDDSVLNLEWDLTILPNVSGNIYETIRGEFVHYSGTLIYTVTDGDNIAGTSAANVSLITLPPRTKIEQTLYDLGYMYIGESYYNFVGYNGISTSENKIFINVNKSSGTFANGDKITLQLNTTIPVFGIKK